MGELENIMLNEINQRKSSAKCFLSYAEARKKSGKKIGGFHENKKGNSEIEEGYGQWGREEG